MKRPLAVLAVFYCLGIVLAGLIKFNFWVIMIAAMMIFSAACLLKGKSCVATLLILSLALLIGALNLQNLCLLPKCHINNFVYYRDNSFYSLSGFVDSQPELKAGRIQFIFRLREVQRGRSSWVSYGKVLVKPEFACKLNYGDNLMLTGNLTRPHNFNAASRGYKDFLQRQGVYLVMHLKDPRQIIRQPGNSGSKLKSSSFWLRNKAEQVIGKYLSDSPAGILCAMVLGQRRGVPRRVNDAFVKSGTVHILVVSGFNVGIVAFILNLLFKIIRIRRKVRIILIIICLLVYCAITGSSNPVVRATIMAVIFLSAYLFKRQPDIYNSLAAAALFILIINPGQLFDIGFQLSFASVLAIIYLYPKLKDLIRLKNCRNKVWRFIAEGCLVSLSAWLGTLGIIAYNFKMIAPVTVFANILIVPLATLITLSGFTLVFSGLIYPGLASLISFPTSMLINLLLNINAAMIKIPFAYIFF